MYTSTRQEEHRARKKHIGDSPVLMYTSQTASHIYHTRLHAGFFIYTLYSKNERTTDCCGLYDASPRLKCRVEMLLIWHCFVALVHYWSNSVLIWLTHKFCILYQHEPIQLGPSLGKLKHGPHSSRSPYSRCEHDLNTCRYPAHRHCCSAQLGWQSQELWAADKDCRVTKAQYASQTLQ